MDELIFNDEEIVCPECGSPEKNETDIETITIQGKKSYVFHFNCTICGKIWYVRKSTKED
jgi:uncharacterized Zn finger protein